MATRFDRALRMAALGLVTMGTGAIARGEPRAEQNHDKGLTVRERLPEVPELRLTFPSFAKSFAFGAFAQSRLDATISLWEAKAHWLEWNNVRLLTVGRVREALELDCRLLCEPFIARSLGMELRLLPASVADDTGNYLVGSGDIVTRPEQQFTRWEISLGGPL